MKCDFCSYEFTLKEIQQGIECPKCAARRVEEQVEKSKFDSVSPAVRDAVKMYIGAQPVVVVDVRMSFSSMVIFMVKWVLASVPAFIILTVILAVVVGALSAIPK